MGKQKWLLLGAAVLFGTVFTYAVFNALGLHSADEQIAVTRFAPTTERTPSTTAQPTAIPSPTGGVTSTQTPASPTRTLNPTHTPSPTRTRSGPARLLQELPAGEAINWVIDNEFLSSLEGPFIFQPVPNDIGYELTINTHSSPRFSQPASNIPLPVIIGDPISAQPPRATLTPAPPAQCPPPGNPAVTPGAWDAKAFLNAGGSVANLEKLLNSKESIHHGYRSGSSSGKIAHTDLTGDSVPDVLVLWGGTAGINPYHASLSFFTCRDGQYQGDRILSVQGHILYYSDSGFWDIRDMNGNGLPDLVFSYEDTYGVGGAGKYFQILEWDGDQLVSLVNSATSAIPAACGQGAVSDLDGNGSTELVVQHNFPCHDIDERGKRIDVYAWDGKHFALAYQKELTQTTPAVTLRPSWTHYTVYDGMLASNSVWAITVAPDGAVWVGTTEGVSRFDGKEWVYYDSEHSPLGSPVFAISATPDGVLWFGSRTMGIARLEGETWITRTHGLPGGTVHSLGTAPDGSVWVGMERGAAHFSGDTWTIHRQGSLAATWVVDIAIAPDNSVWLAGGINGIFHFDGETWTHYTHSVDRSTTPSTSVLRFDGETWPDYDPDSSPVGAIAVTSDGALWFNTVNGVSRFDGQTRTTYTTADGLPDSSVRVLTVAPDGTLWAGTHEGVAWFDGTRWNPLVVMDTPPDPPTLTTALHEVIALTIEPDGTIWIGTMDKGLWRYEPPD